MRVTTRNLENEKKEAAKMEKKSINLIALLFVFLLNIAISSGQEKIASRQGISSFSKEEVGKSPWGAADEIGALNMMTDESRSSILSRISGGKVYDLAVEYFVGMPSWSALGDPRYQQWMTHTPQGTIVANPTKVPRAVNEKVTYSGDAFSMYTHTGTHIDTLNHFGLNGKIWNGFDARENLGSRAWQKGGADKYPLIIARGVLIDVAKAKGVEMLPDSYVITPEDLRQALAKQKTELRPGDVVLFRTGRMKLWADEKYMQNSPGLGLQAARWLVEEKKAMLLGGDTLSFEKLPSERADNWIPVHTYLLAERGVSIIEVLWLEDLARDGVYEFAFIAAPLKLRGATGSPMRPIAIPIRK